MFPHTVTIFNVLKDKDKIIYHRNIISNVFYHVNKIISSEGNGEKVSYKYNVIFSSEALEKWLPKLEFKGEKETFTLRDNDIISLGECESINDLNELQKSNVNYFLIKNVSENLYGDKELWNIEVTN